MMLLTALATLLALPITSTLATNIPWSPLGTLTGCSLRDATLTLPPNSNNFTVDSTAHPRYILLGSGVQNYTCSAAGTYASAGAVANLYDLSCLYKKPEIFKDVEDKWFDLGPQVIAGLERVLVRTPFFVGHHYFITNPLTGTGISPKFALAANGGSRFIVAARTSGIPAPTGPPDVDWLRLDRLQGPSGGDLAQTVYRVDTDHGLPPASCAPNSAPISVPYATKYYLF